MKYAKEELKYEKGIHMDWSIKDKPYRVQFKVNGKTTHFGYYKTLTEARVKRDEVYRI